MSNRNRSRRVVLRAGMSNGREEDGACEGAYLAARDGIEEMLGNLPLLPVCIQSTPNLEFFSLACRDLILARVSMGLRPEFSARAIGTESSASANARIAYCSRPGLCNIVRYDLMSSIVGHLPSPPHPRLPTNMQSLQHRLHRRSDCLGRDSGQRKVRHVVIVSLHQ